MQLHEAGTKDWLKRKIWLERKILWESLEVVAMSTSLLELVGQRKCYCPASGA